MKGNRRLVCLVVALPLTACAGGTLGSGVGDTWMDRPPYYAGAGPDRVLDAASTRGIAYAPVGLQAVPGEPADFGPSIDDGTPLRRLIDALDGHLETLARERNWTPASPPRGLGPDVVAGCGIDAWGECVVEEDEAGNPTWDDRFRLAVTRASTSWQEDAGALLAAGDAAGLLLVTLEVGQYWPRQTNWRGSKAVDLGTDRTVSLPWLTALDAPVSVLQLTGVLVGPDGKARRIGAEGLRVRRTPLLLSGFGIQALIHDEDVEAALTERVGEESGDPFVWEVALETLVDRLTGRDVSRRAGR